MTLGYPRKYLFFFLKLVDTKGGCKWRKSNHRSEQFTDVIASHYPARDARDIPRNVRIMVTFKESMDTSTIIDNNKIFVGRIIIRKSEDSDEQALTDVQAFTNDDQTFVFVPPLLGNARFDTPYTVTLTKDGYNDETETLIVPLDETETMRLGESGVIEDIACTLTIEAREEYFPEIDKVIGPYAGANRTLDEREKMEVEPNDAETEKERKEIQELNEQGIRIFQYNIEVDDSR